MTLTRCRLGDLIELIERKNDELLYGIDDVRGINNQKKMIRTKADVSGRDFSKFYIVEPGEFIFNHRTSRNGEKFSITMNYEDRAYIFTDDYVLFRVHDAGRKIIDPTWLYLFFCRSEFDRFVITNSWGSSTEFYNWVDICDVEIDLPPIEVQKRYVAIYNSMLENQRCYEHGLDDLKLVCDGYIEDLRKKYPLQRLESFITRQDERNSDNAIKNVKGVSTSKVFRDPTSKVDRENLQNYKIVHPRQFSFVQTTHNEKVFAYALNLTSEDIVVTSVNEVFSVDESQLVPEYLALFFNRTEFDRYARYHSWGSARETFVWSDLCDVTIPVPSLEVQRSIADIYSVFCERRAISERLKNQIKNLCPILIKGSLEEASRR